MFKIHTQTTRSYYWFAGFTNDVSQEAMLSNNPADAVLVCEGDLPDVISKITSIYEVYRIEIIRSYE